MFNTNNKPREIIQISSTKHSLLEKLIGPHSSSFCFFFSFFFFLLLLLSFASQSCRTASFSVLLRLDNILLCYFSVITASVFCQRWRWHSLVVAVESCVDKKRTQKNMKKRRRRKKRRKAKDNKMRMTQTRSNKRILQ